MASDTTQDASAISGELARGRFTDEMLQEMRALIGTELRTAASVNNEDATRLAILRFTEGIGDDNPLWTDPEVRSSARAFGGIVAPPSFIFACLGSVQVGWRGLGGFHAETKLTFHRPIRLGDHITARVFFDGFDGPIREPVRGAADQGLPSPGVLQPGRAAGRALHMLADALRAHRDAGSRRIPARSRSRTRGPTRSFTRSRSKSWPKLRGARHRATGTTSRSETRSK